MIATPQTAIAPRTTAPCRSTRVTQPDDSPISSAPIETPANSQPRLFADSANRVCDSSGKTACGQANVIAMMSTTKVMSSTGCVRRNAKPSATPRTAALIRSRSTTTPRRQRRQSSQQERRDHEPDRVDGVGEEQVAQPDQDARRAAARR